MTQRDYYIGLVFQCPVSESNLPGCFLYGLRLLPIKERIAWWQTLGHEERLALIATHKACLRCQENLPPL